MKKILTLLLIIATGWIAKADYHPMLNNASWIIKVYPFISPEPYYEVIEQGNNVVIGQYTYLKIYDPVYHQDLYFREDVATKKVYQYANGTDLIVFDFNLEVSETITFENGITYSVTSVTEVAVNTGTRKAITLHSVLGSEYWIEGIGSNRHPLISHMVLSEPDVILRCNFQNQINIYSAANTDCENLLKLAKNNCLNFGMKLYPNPFTIETTIELTENLQNGNLKIFNTLGQIVKEVQNINGKTIILRREDLMDGIYHLQLFEDKKFIAYKKVAVGYQ